MSTDSTLLDIRIEPFQRFASVDEYREFFQLFSAARQNAVLMEVEGQTAWTQICDPDYDIDLARILNDERFKDAKWHIAPVLRTNERLFSTDQRNYRFMIHDEIVQRYRQDMMNGAFFPLLAFDAKRQFWPSGQHRLQAAQGKFEAHFSVVFEDLTEEQVTLIYEMTNLHHSNGYSKHERMNLFHDVSSMEGVSDREALRRLGLKINQPKLVHLAVKLIRKHPDLAYSWSREKETGRWKCGGRLKEFVAIGFNVERMGGERAIEELDMEDWIPVLNSGVQFLLVRKLFPLTDTPVPSDDNDESLTPKERVRNFLKYVERVQLTKSLKDSGVTQQSFDEGRILDIAKYIITTNKDDLIQLREMLDEEQREYVARAVYKFSRIFGAEDDNA